ncbi:hypothetical protein SKAU_G00271800 [Synaphobranchus kaupii]|uniref:Uncharacterized protein n=1 Tax=Synaphobranchus kaupii TaxID=118154 RepID=A0A9Q1F0I0_SYNKA|nr:hypothetical protein SKAU_G00271800 [Synaphobranchus kaupii]
MDCVGPMVTVEANIPSLRVTNQTGISIHPTAHLTTKKTVGYEIQSPTYLVAYLFSNFLQWNAVLLAAKRHCYKSLYRFILKRQKPFAETCNR